MEPAIRITLLIVGAYLIIGALFSIFFLWKGINKVDPGAKDSGVLFKILIFPGMTVFWIFFLRKWIK